MQVFMDAVQFWKFLSDERLDLSRSLSIVSAGKYRILSWLGHAA